MEKDADFAIVFTDLLVGITRKIYYDVTKLVLLTKSFLSINNTEIINVRNMSNSRPLSCRLLGTLLN